MLRIGRIGQVIAETFPKYICYDNSCQLHNFVMNRDISHQRANFLVNELFVIDRLHVKGHGKRLISQIYTENSMVYIK